MHLACLDSNRCLVPKIMLFDEPTSALDAEMIKEVLEIMIDLARDFSKGTDFHAISEGCISITPMQLDLTNHVRQASMRDSGWDRE